MIIISKEDIWKIMLEHLKTYNEHDLDGFMNTMSEDIEVHMLLTKQTIKGQKDVRTFYEGAWKQYVGVKVEFSQKILSGNVVVVEETVIEAQNTDLVGMKVIVVNEIADGKIKRFWILQ